MERGLRCVPAGAVCGLQGLGYVRFNPEILADKIFMSDTTTIEQVISDQLNKCHSSSNLEEVSSLLNILAKF